MAGFNTNLTNDIGGNQNRQMTWKPRKHSFLRNKNEDNVKGREKKKRLYRIDHER